MHTDTIGYKIRLLHNQIHKRMEAKRQENEKEPLTGMQRWTLGFLRDHDGKDIYQSWRGKGLCAVRRWSMMRD